MPSPYGLAIEDRCVVCKLRNESFFCSLPAAVLHEFEKLKTSTVFPKGAVLFVEGQTPRGIHMLCQGEVKLSTTFRDGRTLILKVARPGEILGLSSCISGLSFEVTAEAHTPCQTNFVRRRDFLRFLREHGGACLRAAEQLGVQHQGAMAVIRTIGDRHHASASCGLLLMVSQSTQNTALGGTLRSQRSAGGQAQPTKYNLELTAKVHEIPAAELKLIIESMTRLAEAGGAVESLHINVESAFDAQGVLRAA
jgi:CRP/FNR family transcriptional regulator, cyclic AMP receptor protein